MSLHGRKHQLQGSRTPRKWLKLFCCETVTEEKPNHSMGPVTTESVSTALHLELPRELGSEKVQIGEGRGKSGNWESLTAGSSEGKLLPLMGWDPGKAQAALSSGNEAHPLCWGRPLPLSECPEEATDRKSFRKMHWKRNVCRAGKGQREITTFCLSGEPQKGLLSIQATSWSQTLIFQCEMNCQGSMP